MDEDAMLAELLNPQFRAVPGAASPGTSRRSAIKRPWIA